MADATTEDIHIGFLQTVGTECPQGSGQNIEVGESGACPDEGVPTDDAQLQTGVLGHHCVFHHRGHEERGPEWQKAAVADNTQHQLAALRDIDVISDDAVVDDDAGANGDIVANGCWAVDDG